MQMRMVGGAIGALVLLAACSGTPQVTVIIEQSGQDAGSVDAGVSMDATTPSDAGSAGDAALDTSPIEDAAPDVQSDAFVCAAAACNASRGWNCDPACGPVDTNCDATACDTVTSATIVGTVYTRIQLAPLSLRQTSCSPCGLGSMWWSMRIKLTASDGFCVTIQAPKGVTATVETVTTGAPPPLLCQPMRSHGCVDTTISPTAVGDTYVLFGFDEKTIGSVVDIDVEPGFCQAPRCDTCNGSSF
jgi:hypothetical protein